ncbi:MAG: carboxypeptidase regulatory-like domain-containing protein [Planctomycetota bacterium]
MTSKKHGNVADRNVERLIARAYRPLAPSARFDKQLLSVMQNQALRRRRMRWTTQSLSAAALLLIGLFVALVIAPDREDGEESATPVAASGSAYYHYTSEDDRWSAVEGEQSLVRGDVVATGSKPAGIDTGRSAIELKPESTLVLGGDATSPGGHLGRGRATIATSGDQETQLSVAYLGISTHGATFEASIAQVPPALPIDKEFEMNGRIVVGATAAIAVVITIAVWKSTDEDVTVEKPDGSRVTLGPGETGTFEGGDHSVAANRGARGADGSSSKTAGRTATGDPSDPTVASESDTVHGHVVDVTGAPILEARVRFERPDEEAGGVSILARAITDEEGAFSFDIPRGAMGVVVGEHERHPEGRLEWPPAGSEEHAEDGGNANSSEVKSDAESKEVADTPRAFDPIVLMLAAETAISGRFFDETTGEPLDKALVGVQRYFDQYRRDEPQIRLFESEDGTFYWGGLPPGKYRVWAYRSGYCISGEANIELAAGQHYEGIELAVVPGHEATGSIFSKRTGRPIEGAIVYAHLAHLPGTVNMLDRVELDDRVGNADRTNARGEFVVKDLPPGKVLLRVLHPDYIPLDTWVELGEDETPPVELALLQGTGFRGTVLDSSGEANPDHRVIAVTMSANPELSHMTWGEVGLDGNYHIPNLSPGPYVVVLLDLENPDPNGGVVRMELLGASEDRVVDFIEDPALATVRGKVVDESGAPLKGIAVSLMAQTDPADPNNEGGFKFESGITDAEGFYEIGNLRPEQTYSVGISKNNSGTFTVVGEVDCEEAADYEKNLKFIDLSVTGRVTDTEGEPVKNAEIFVLRRRGEEGPFSEFSGRSLTDHDGQYTIDGLPAGQYRVIARAAGYSMGMGSTPKLDPDLERSCEVDLTLPPGGELVVSVVNQYDQPVAGVLVQLFDANGGLANGSLDMATDEFGQYKFASLNAGRYQVKLFREGSPIGEKSFECDLGTPEKVSFKIDLE